MAARSLRRSRAPVLLRRRQADAARHGRGEDIVRPAPDDGASTGSGATIESRARATAGSGASRAPATTCVRSTSHPDAARPGAHAGHEATQSTARTPDADSDAVSVVRYRPPAAVPGLSDFGDDRFAAGVDHNSQDPLSRPLKIAYAVVFVVLVVSALGLVYVQFHHTGGRHPTQADGTTTTSSTSRTTTTMALPTALQPGAEAAATALVSNWIAGNRTAALTVATQAAVTTPLRRALRQRTGPRSWVQHLVHTDRVHVWTPGRGIAHRPDLRNRRLPNGWWVVRELGQDRELSSDRTKTESRLRPEIRRTLRGRDPSGIGVARAAVTDAHELDSRQTPLTSAGCRVRYLFTNLTPAVHVRSHDSCSSGATMGLTILTSIKIPATV